VKKLIEQALNEAEIDGIDTTKPIFTRVTELADSSVNLKAFVWSDALLRGAISSQVLAVIYDTLNENNIEIPFPQQDVHIKN
jgi:small-conductance mechanosensitive channel